MSEFEHNGWGPALRHDSDWEGVSVLFAISEVKVEVLREVSQQDLQIALCKSLAKADALASAPGKVAHGVTLLARGSQEQGRG